MDNEAYSIADAKNGLARLVHQAEKRSPVVITRRGRPVAVLVSYDEYERLAHRRSFSEALDRYLENRATLPSDLDAVFENLRDPSPGRDVPL
jgi:prevent-host-death family protein